MATAPATKRLPNIKGWVYDDEDSYCRVEDEEAREMVTDAYDPTATYTKGETCIQDNKLYRAKADIATAEIWTPDHWEETSLEQIRKEMAAELSTLNAKTEFLIESVDISGTVVTAGNASSMVQKNIEKTGYKPLGISGIQNLTTASLLIQSCYISDSGTRLTYKLRNVGGSDATTSGVIFVLYQKIS